MNQENTEDNIQHFLAYNIISLIRDELPQDKKELLYQLSWFDDFYKNTLLMLLKKDKDCLCLIRQADDNALKELHNILVKTIVLPTKN